MNSTEVIEYLQERRDRLERDEPYAVDTIAAYDTVISEIANS